MVQFHQSYSYEDFIRGYRSLPDKAGSFGLQDGIFSTSASARRKIQTTHTCLLLMRSTGATLARYLVSC